MTAYKKGWLRASIAGGITSLLTLFLYLSGQPHQVNKSTFLTGLIVAIILATAPITTITVYRSNSNHFCTSLSCVLPSFQFSVYPDGIPCIMSWTS